MEPCPDPPPLSPSQRPHPLPGAPHPISSALRLLPSASSPALSLTRISHGINHDRLGPGAPAAPVPRPAGLGPHLGLVAAAWPHVQDFFPGCSWNLQDLRGRAELGARLLWGGQGAEGRVRLV